MDGAGGIGVGKDGDKSLSIFDSYRERPTWVVGIPNPNKKFPLFSRDGFGFDAKGAKATLIGKGLTRVVCPCRRTAKRSQSIRDSRVRSVRLLRIADPPLHQVPDTLGTFWGLTKTRLAANVRESL